MVEVRIATAPAHFGRHASCRASDAPFPTPSPLDLRVDRWIRVRIGEGRLQPTYAVMPHDVSDFDAPWHADFLGLIDIASALDLATMIRTFRRAQACEIVVAVAGDGLDVAVARAADGWNVVRPLPDDVIAAMGASVAASAFRR